MLKKLVPKDYSDTPKPNSVLMINMYLLATHHDMTHIQYTETIVSIPVNFPYD